METCNTNFVFGTFVPLYKLYDDVNLRVILFFIAGQKTLDSGSSTNVPITYYLMFHVITLFDSDKQGHCVNLSSHRDCF